MALALLAVLRIAATFTHSMWPWGANLLRFLPAPAALALGALPVLALVPACARPLAPWAARLGDALGRPAAGAIVFVLGSALAWSFPERVWFTGDGRVRADAYETARGFLPLFPQAMPGDQWLHDTLPRWIAAAGGPVMGTSARVLGALELGALAWLVVAFARALRLRGAAALAAAAVVTCGGALTLFTGYAKPAGEMVLLSAAVGVFALRLLAEGRGALALGLALALGVALHRSALIAFPAGAAALIGYSRRADAGRAWRRAALVGGATLPVVALAALGPRLLHVITGFDREHHFAAAGGGSFARQLFEVLNALLVLSPLALALPAVLIADRGRALRSREGLALVPLAALGLATMLIVHPQQGIYRDWDVFAGAAVALSLVTAWRVGAALQSAPRHAWLAVPIVIGLAAPALGWLIHDHDAPRGLIRAHAFVTEAPERAKSERAAIWDFLGIRSLELGNLEATAEAFSHAASLAPSPRLLTQWGLAENHLVHLERAQSLYRRALERDSTYDAAWLLLATVSLRMGDSTEARRAATTLARHDPGNSTALEVLSRLGR